jgi:acyl-CoA synthetase (AMP-forming)/AMP-acid ligase II
MKQEISMKQDISGLQVRWNEVQAQAWVQAGSWPDKTIADRARASAAAEPGRVTHVDGVHQLTAGQAWEQSGRLAAALWAQGWRAGQVLAFMTPNWHEAVLIDLAACRLGLVLCPIVPIYRDREVQQILADSGARGIFIAESFRGFDYALMMVRLRPALPRLQQVFTVRAAAAGANDLRSLIDKAPALPTLPAVSPDAVKLMLYTSGTTGHAKAVLHSHNTLARATHIGAHHWGVRPGHSTLMPSPVTHVTGFCNGLELPFFMASRCVLMDQWNAAEAADLIDREQISFTLCATPFLQELLDVAEQQGRRLPSLRSFPCGGAAVPPELIHRVARVLQNCRAFRVYGSSEAPLITLGYLGDGQARLAAETDGEVVDYEVRIVDAAGQALPDGAEGEICARGPALFLGYARADDSAAAFDADGYFHTGDVGYLSVERAIVFTGRIKDLINRGGEKISAKEVEDLLHSHPGVLQAAVVAMPHARLGETLCAYLIAEPGADVRFEAVLATLAAAGVARQKHPERLFIVETFPTTASGKVKKDLLRADVLRRLRDEAQADPTGLLPAPIQ